MFRKYKYLFFLSIVLIILLSVEGIYFFGNDLPYSKEIVVRRGEGLSSVADNLTNEGAIRGKWLFYFYILLRGQARDIKAGTYLISPEESIADVSEKIISGDTIKEKVVIPEGFGISEIASLLGKKGICNEGDFLRTTGYFKNKPIKDFSPEFPFLESKPPGTSLEGFLFPDTYIFEKSDNPENIVRIMLNNFGKKLTPRLRKEISRQNKTIFEVVNMASLIEKEASNSEDKKIISGILWKRLRYHMPLQVDATICYVNDGNCYRLSKEDLKIDSPYNTYKHQGLPPTPICNPGLDSLISAIYPKNSDYWYYLSTPDGKTIFSKTLKEHNINKFKYLR